MLNIDNIFSLRKDGSIVKPEKSKIGLISHAHFDHIPSRFDMKYICSKETKRIVEYRKKRKINTTFDFGIKMLDSGHVIGGKMFYLKKYDLLYTGDFNTIDKPFISPAKPKKIKTLIIEGTYGHPRYVFPDYKEEVKRMLDYVKDKKKVILDAYTFGKAQELCYFLNKEKISFNVSYHVGMINKLLRLKFKYFDNTEKDVIVGDIGSDEHSRIRPSGWTLDTEEEGHFCISDHADYPNLIKFIEKCQPEKIYVIHEGKNQFSAELQNLGWDARPILSDQKRIRDFFN